MIVFNADWVIVLATVIWLLWRVVTWRRSGGDVVRESAVALLFAWSLVVVFYTLFPLNIIFYDWHGRFSLVPLASTVQLITETSFTVAFRNIVGNLLLLVPLGVLLPLLFKPLQRLWPLVWRVAVISAIIEAAQLVTRARAVDIDDVIFNTTGAAFGFGLYWLFARLLGRSANGSAYLDRLGTQPRREPLTLAAVPVLLTAAIVVPVMVSMIISATLGGGASGIAADATSVWQGSSVIARGDIGTDTILVVKAGDEGSERIGFVGYEKVLPGRYTWVVRSDGLIPVEGSQFAWGITSYNVAIGELPTIYVWGSNQSEAVAISIRGRDFDEELPLPGSPYFAVGFKYRPDITAAVLEDFEFRFIDSSGRDVTEEFSSLD